MRRVRVASRHHDRGMLWLAPALLVGRNHAVEPARPATVEVTTTAPSTQRPSSLVPPTLEDTPAPDANRGESTVEPPAELPAPELPARRPPSAEHLDQL